MTNPEHDEQKNTLQVAVVVGLVFAIAIAATAWAIIVGLDARPGSPATDPGQDLEQELIERRLEAASESAD